MAEVTIENFLADGPWDEIDWQQSNHPTSLAPETVVLGHGDNRLEVAIASHTPTHLGRTPLVEDIRRLWSARWARRASPVLLVVGYQDTDGNWKAAVCGTRDNPAVEPALSLAQVDRVCRAALAAPTPAQADRTLHRLLGSLKDGFTPGLTNSGLFASHELRVGVPVRTDWADAATAGIRARDRRGADLISALGFTSAPHGSTTHILTVATGPTTGTTGASGSGGGERRAVAVLLDESETFERPGARFGAVSPVAQGLAVAQQQNLPWLVVTRGTQIRLYPTTPDVGVGRKGQSETYVEVDLALLDDEHAAYLPLLFSAGALADGGSVTQILAASVDHATALGARLRERVYNDVVPSLAVAVARSTGADTDEALAEAYHRTLVILFRLLFVAYAEDRGLLPYKRNPLYTRRALKTMARELHENPDLVFDNQATDRWEDLLKVWRAVDDGNREWGVPAYNGGLFAADEHHPSGAAIAQMSLSNAEIGPALRALLVDVGDNDERGPVDFRALTVRQFGDVYEGLLESSLSIAPTDLTVDPRTGAYLPAAKGSAVTIPAGQVYFHNASGARKATGSYFTKAFAVEHLLDSALEPALTVHLERVERHLARGDDAAAADAFFDFRIADLAMGSGHFLVAAIDRIEARFSAFLVAHPIPAVTAELSRLTIAAFTALGDSAPETEIETSALLRRQIARRCIYGLDLNVMAVELARLSIWIHTFVPGLPMSTLDHGLVTGNSLTGIATIAEVLNILDPADHRGPAQDSLFHAQITGALSGASDRLIRVATTSEATKREVSQAAAEYAKARRETADVKALFDAATAARLGLAPLPLTPDDAVTQGHRPEVTDALAATGPAQFPVLFPEVFLRDNPGFDCLVGNPPWEEATVEESKFWGVRFPGLRSDNTNLLAQIARLRSERPDLVAEYDAEVVRTAQVRAALLSGDFPGMGTGDPDLYKGFIWRFWRMCREGGAIGVVLPRSVFLAKGSAPWRTEVLPAADLSIVMAKNYREWLFTDVNEGYPICLTAIQRREAGDRNGTLQIRGVYTSASEFAAGMARPATPLLAERLAAADPLMCVPAVEDDASVGLFERLLRRPTFGDPHRTDFVAIPNTELHATNDGKVFFTNRPTDAPVYNHLNVGHFTFNPDAGTFNYAKESEVAREQQAKRVKGASNSRSPYSRMPPGWAQNRPTLPLANPRILLRDVVHSSNPRKVWAALAPAHVIVTNKAPYLMFARGDLTAQAYLLGILNSSVCDWFGHLRVNLNLNFFILNSIPIPTFDPTDPQALRLAELAARLATAAAGDSSGGYGDWTSLGAPISEPAQVAEALAELDALASLLYELDPEHLPLVFSKPTRPDPIDVGRWRTHWQERRPAAPASTQTAAEDGR